MFLLVLVFYCVVGHCHKSAVKRVEMSKDVLISAINSTRSMIKRICDCAHRASDRAHLCSSPRAAIERIPRTLVFPA